MTKPHNRSIEPLLPIAERGIPFTSSDGQPFVRLNASSPTGFRIVPLRSRAFRDWFFSQFFADYETLPTSQAFHAIRNHLEAQASQSQSNSHLAVWRRVGSRGPFLKPDQILLDLANPEGQFVAISPSGWTVTQGANALLQTSRPTGEMLAPVPCKNPAAALETLRSLLNLPSRSAWLRCLAWLMAAFRPHGPVPFLVLHGPPASGKTFAARILRTLVDPCSSPLTPIPSSARDLLALARHNWVLAFDHISDLSPQLTDALCRLSSGIGFSLREEPSSSEPLQQYYKRPVLLTVTNRFSPLPDFAARALTATLPPLFDPRTEMDLMTVFVEAYPRILGALCSAVGAALGRMQSGPPAVGRPSGRLADALVWAMAAAPALDCTEEEMRQAFIPAPPPHPMVEAVRTLLEQRRRWTGTATQLLELLQSAVSCRTPKGVSQQLNICALRLADTGIELRFKRKSKGVRIIELAGDPGNASRPKNPPDASQNSHPSPQPTEAEELNAA